MKTIKLLCFANQIILLLLIGLTYVNAQTVKIYPSTVRVEKGKTKTITAVAYNSSNQPVFNASFNFSDSNSGVASLSAVKVRADDTIGSDGPPPPNLRTITGITAGTRTVTATWNGITSSPATILVDDPAVSPTAIIHGDNDSGGGATITTKVGEAIEINGEASSGVSQIEWEWGDGDKTTDLLSATHAYLIAGTYSLKLKITNSFGQIAISTVTVNVQSQTACTPSNTETAVSINDLRLKYEALPLSGGKCILLAPGVYVGELELIARNFTDYVTIGSNAAMPNILNRVSPNEAGLVTIRSSSNIPSVTPVVIKNGATKLRFVGIKFDPAYAPPNNSDVNSNYYVVQIGEAFNQTNISQNPTKIIFEHCVINPNDDVKIPHGVLNDGYKVSIISSWLGNIKTFGAQDSQAVFSINGKGAHIYNNTFLEAASENVIYGGAVPGIDELVSTNIEFRRCYFTKRLSWKAFVSCGDGGICHQINEKNLFETKNARRLYVEGSILENHWDALRSQLFSLVFKTATSPGSEGEFVPWAISEDIVFENNKINHIYGGITTSVDNYGLAPFHGLKPSNIIIKNSLFDDLSSTRWGFPGNTSLDARFLQPNNVEDLQLNHVTMIDKDQTAGEAIFLTTNNNFRLNIKNSIFGLNDYGIFGDGVSVGIRALNPGTGGGNNNCIRDTNATWNLSRNIMPIYGESTNCYPEPTVPPATNQTANFYPTNYNGIGFINLAGGNYELSSSSIYKNQGTDSQDPGANISVLNQRTSCTINGNTGSCLGLPPSTQTPYPGQTPPNILTTVEVENFDNGGQGIAYNDAFGSTSSNAYRFNPVETVDILANANASNGFAVFEAAAGEWLEYTVNVPASGLYNFSVKYSSGYTQQFSQGQFKIEVCEPTSSGGVTNCVSSQNIRVNSTGAWSAYKTVKAPIYLPSSGTRILRLIMVTNAPGDTNCNCVVANFDAITISNQRTLFDYDNDRKADISVFRPSNNTWYLQQSTAGFGAVTYGVSADIITPADFDGDGKTDIAIWRPSTGVWYILNSSNNSATIVSFGSNGDIPVQADYDGDGKADIAVWRPSDGVWYRLNSSDNSFFASAFGSNGDKPTVGDYDGDGKYDLAIFRPSNGVWYLQQSVAGFSSIQFGQNADTVTPGDYDGDGKTDISVFRPSDNTWYRLNSGNGQFVGFQFGVSGDIPSPADFDGDGKIDTTVFRPSNGVWYIQQTTAGFTSQTFGLNSDIPTSSTYVR